MNPKRSKVGVIIVNWNSFDLLKRCMESLDLQTATITRIVIADNHSQARPAIPPVSARFPTEYLWLDHNTGFAQANNIAITKLADCEWVALVNPDAFPTPHWLEKLLAAAERHPDAGSFAGPTFMDGHPELLDGAGDAYHLTGLPWRTGHGQPREKMPCVEREIFSTCAAAALYRLSALQDVGTFDEDFFCYCEDVDLGFRLRLGGYPALFVPDAEAYHVGSATTGGKHSNTSIYYGHRNMVWVFVKNMPSPLFELLLVPHLLATLIVWLRFTLSGQGKIILRAKKDALKGIPSMWKKRRRIQAARKIPAKEIWKIIVKSPTSRKLLRYKNESKKISV